MIIPSPLDYFPLRDRPFEFSVGLRALADDPANRYERVIQLDNQWPRYRRAKLKARRECLDKYLCAAHLSEAVESHAASLLLKRLSQEYPMYFHLDSGVSILSCRLTGERLIFDSALRLIEADGSKTAPTYRDALDALCCQIQEDLAIVELRNDQAIITYLHLCLPNYWAAADKIGRGFTEAHAPVPVMDKINAKAHQLINSLLTKGPFERFTWGLTCDNRLNHHPSPPPRWNAETWHGRRFDPQHPALYLRIERQVTLPCPKVNAFLFMIRTYCRAVKTLCRAEIERLLGAIQTMPPAILAYKGLAADRDRIIAWLQRLLR